MFTMGEIAARYRRSMLELRTSAPAACAKVSGKRWQKLVKAMERGRLSVADDGDA